MAISNKQFIDQIYKDWGSSPSDSANSLKKRCDQLSKFLFIAMQTLEENNIDSYVLLKHDDLRKWYSGYKEELRRYNEAQEAKRVKAEIKARALARLTEEEKLALGLTRK